VLAAHRCAAQQVASLLSGVLMMITITRQVTHHQNILINLAVHFHIVSKMSGTQRRAKGWEE
jgi:hypothetical protein